MTTNDKTAGDEREQSIMFLVYEYARVSEGIDAADGEKRTEQRRAMQAKGAEIRAALASLTTPSKEPAGAVACYIHRDQLARLQGRPVDDSDACVRYANGFPNWVPDNIRSEYIPLALATPDAVPTDNVWPQYIAGIIETYIKQNRTDEDREAGIAGIIERRLKFLAAPGAAIDAREQEADPMDWPLPCDVTVGHGTMRKGVALRTLVLRMKSLYEMATGNDADVIASRTTEERKVLTDRFLAAIHDKRPLHEQIAEIHRRERPTAEILNMMVGASPEEPPAVDAGEKEGIEPQLHHLGRWIDNQNPGWSFPSKEAAFAARGAINTARLAWLHASNKDAEGYEYGVCKVKFDAAGKLESFFWTASDSSDVDAAMSAAGVAK